MTFEDILDDEYVCKSCKLVYGVYGSRKRCDLCNRRLKLTSKNDVLRLLEVWGANP